MSKNPSARWLELHESIPRWVARLIRHRRSFAEDEGPNYLKVAEKYNISYEQVLSHLQSKEEHILLNYLASPNPKITESDKNFVINLLLTHCAERWQWSIIPHFLFSDKGHYNSVGAELSRYYDSYEKWGENTATITALAGISSDSEESDS